MSGLVTEEEARNVFMAFQTSRKMLVKRGYIVPDSGLTLEKLKTNMDAGAKKSVLNFVAEKPTNESARDNGMEVDDKPEKIFVIFSDDKKIGIEDFRKIHERVEKAQAQRAILLLDAIPSAVVRNGIARMSEKCKYETFKMGELLVDITEHELVPEHVVLTEEEKKNMLKRYNLKETQLPRMLISDPISRYYGLDRGQVVKIIRDSETAGRYVTYRIVI